MFIIARTRSLSVFRSLRSNSFVVDTAHSPREQRFRSQISETSARRLGLNLGALSIIEKKGENHSTLEKEPKLLPSSPEQSFLAIIFTLFGQSNFIRSLPQPLLSISHLVDNVHTTNELSMSTQTEFVAPRALPCLPSIVEGLFDT
jgi:hypothetical protein